MGSVWTLSVIGGFLLIDRVFFGPVERIGWLQVDRISDIPKGAGRRVFPAYLPQELGWPPVRIFHRERPVSGWWYGVASAADPDDIVLWLGAGAEPLPGEASGLAECLRDRVRCPEGWRVFSTDAGGVPVYIITRIDPAVATQILVELKPEH